MRRSSKSQRAGKLLAQAGRGGSALDHFVDAFEWTIPTLFRLVDGELAYEASRPPFRRVRAGPGLLEEFVTLDDAPDSAILHYARQWGPLWLCKHGDPWREHLGECGPNQADLGTADADTDEEPSGELESIAEFADDFEDAELEQLDNTEDDTELDRTLEYADHSPPAELWYADPLHGWRHLATRARATLLVASKLHREKLAPLEEWRETGDLDDAIMDVFAPVSEDLELHEAAVHIDPDEDLAYEALPPALRPPLWDAVEAQHIRELRLYAETDPVVVRLKAEAYARIDRSLQFQQALLAAVVNQWLAMGGVKPRLQWNDNRLSIRLAGWGLLGAVAIQLLLDCSRTEGLAICAGCRKPFIPQGRRPRRDRSAYCPTCGTRAAARDAAARYRATTKYQNARAKRRRQGVR